jgi:hypothetical protein
MAYEKINWTSTTPINTNNLNQMQTNTENALNGLQNEINEKTGITKYNIANFLKNGWGTNAGNNVWIDKDGVKHLQLAVRNGTDPLICILPEVLRPSTTAIIPIFNYASVGYAMILPTGEVTAYGNAYVSGGNILINVSYI